MFANLPKELKIQTLYLMDLDTISSLCKSNSEWRNLCRDINIQNLVQSLYKQKIEEEKSTFWTILDTLGDMDNTNVENYSEEDKRSDIDEQLVYLSQFSDNKLRRFFDWYVELYNQVSDAIAEAERAVPYQLLHDPNNYPYLYPFEEDEFDDFISHLLTLGKDEILNIIKDPKITYDPSYWEKNPGFVTDVLLERIKID